MKAKIVICASGEGTTFEAIVAATRSGTLNAEVVGLVSNRPKVAVLGRARRLGIPTRVLEPKAFSTRVLWDQALVQQLQAWQTEWVVLAGFLVLIGPSLLQQFAQHIVNSHPSLLPKYGGAGMYGNHVHAAVLNAGELETGVTVHLIDAQYDQGQVLAQLRVPVLAGDTADSLALRVKAAEMHFYPSVLNDLLTGQSAMRGDSVDDKLTTGRRSGNR